MKIFSLVMLLSAFSSLTLMEVVQNFEKSKCSKFFLKSPKNVITPTVLKGHQYKKICQSWKNVYRFATLFDTKRRIPVYSAYTYTDREEDKERNEVWKNEPQLENPTDLPDLKEITREEMEVYFKQAVNRDYTDYNNNHNNQVEYTRGHVYPNQYATDQDQADSTFTFTNIAPQTQRSNSEWEKQVETPMKNKIKNMCDFAKGNLAYIVTGVVPGNKWIPIKRKEKQKPIDEGINIPSYYWTAFCCVSRMLPNVRISHAYLALQNESNEKTFEVSNMSVNVLNKRLSTLYNESFSVFASYVMLTPS